MYVLYQQAIIWVLPVYSTIEKKVEKKVTHLFRNTKGGNFFSHLFWFPDLFMNSCNMWNISLIKIKKIRWTDPISLLPRPPCRPAAHCAAVAHRRRRRPPRSLCRAS
jgi:hypothetical protein